MNSNCFKPNPLQRGGTGRDQRYLKALQPSYIQLDERRIEDLICFADKYAELLAYYDSANKYDGDWKPFVDSDLSTILARVARTKYELVNETWQKYLLKYQSEKTPENYKALFDIIFSLFLEIERINKPEIINTPVKDDLNNEITGRLKGDLKKLIGYYRYGASEIPRLIDIHTVVEPIDDGFKFVAAEEVLKQAFSSIWIHETGEPDTTEWWEYLNEDDTLGLVYIDSDDYIFDGSISFIEAIFKRTFGSYVRIILRAQEHFQHSLKEYSDHKPHNALLLAFFKLFAYAQEDLNALTNKHLKFYFNEVLRIKKKPTKVDSAHVLAELAKNRQQHLIKAGTELKAGKDKTGKELIYTVDKDLVVNKATVDSLKTVFIDETGVFDAPVANSKDGLGEEELDPENPQWRSFGQSQPNSNNEMTMQRSEIGFAIASPILRLKERKRTITFTFTLNQTLTAGALTDRIQVQLSGEKEWINCPQLDSSDSTSDNYIKTETNKLTIKITLSESVDPVVDFNSESLGDAFNTCWPVARFVIRQQVDDKNNTYEILKTIKFAKADINVKVKDARDLIIQNDLGLLDVSKPFLPFGPRPKKGSTLYIGSHEIFSKKVRSIKLSIEWLGLPETSFKSHYSYQDSAGNSMQYLNMSSNKDFKVDAAFLNAGSWNNQATSSHYLFEDRTFEVIHSNNNSSGTGHFVYLSQSTFSGSNIDENKQPSASALKFSTQSSSNSLFLANPMMEEFNSYGLDVKSGFLKLELSAPNQAFGHGLFAKAFAKQSITMTHWRATGNETLPQEPYTPTIKSISCTYTAKTAIQFGNNYQSDTGQFFHIHPFGHEEINGNNSSVFLLSQFNHKFEKVVMPICGALYIGINHIEPGQVISILFQMAEGSEDASKDSGEVVWSFLSDNEWIRLDENIISDSTNGFLASGIVRFKIPEKANNDNTLMPQGMCWLRASISEADSYEAYPLMMDVHAQALSVSFEDRHNDSTHLATPLAAESISKLLRSDSAVKKLQQPYDSFDGQVAESEKYYSQRVAERLRHKNRAITIWDYEHLVLSQFPFIYRAKCLNHSDGSFEMVPGAVRMVVIPDIRGKTGGDKLKPMVSNSNREKIRQYLAALNSTFVDLKVENPSYEAIEVKCSVRFREDDFQYYRQQLQTDIKRFLAPWAFDEEQSVSFGGSIHQSEIIKYIEDLSYVDVITDFSLNVYDEVSEVPRLEGVSNTVASNSRSILTSYTGHQIIPHSTCQTSAGS